MEAPVVDLRSPVDWRPCGRFEVTCRLEAPVDWRVKMQSSRVALNIKVCFFCDQDQS